MERLVWTPALDVGDEQLNDQHRQLIAAMDRLYRLNKKGALKSALVRGFEELIVLTQNHFSAEEAHMRKIKHQGIDAHRQIHEGLLTALESHKAEFEISAAVVVPSAVFDFFSTWLTTHILIVDKKYT